MLRSYKFWWAAAGRSPSTLALYCTYITMFGANRLDATRADCEEFIISAPTPSVREHRFRALHSYFGWLAEEQEIETNPMARVKRPKTPLPAVTAATETDYQALRRTCKVQRPGIALRAVERRDAAILALLYETGMRRGELAALQVEDVDLDACTVLIRTSKNGRPRRVPFGPESQRALERMLRAQPASGPLWLGRRGVFSSNGIQQMIRARAKAAGVDISAHDFRRGLAVRWLLAGGGETALRTIAGWRSPAMVGRYSRMASEDVAHAEYGRLFGTT